MDGWCAQAKKASSIVFCSDPELRQRAIARNQFFETARGKLSPEAYKVLTDDQSRWIKSYTARCGVSIDDPVVPSLPIRTQSSQDTTQITDIELQAAYCLGVATQQIEQTHKRNQSSENKLASKLAPGDSYLLDIVRGVGRDMMQIISERRDRFQDYLKVKGFMSGRNVKSIEVALRRGTTDATQCGIDVDKSTRERCWQDDTCPSSTTCTRVKRCLENFLPF